VVGELQQASGSCTEDDWVVGDPFSSAVMMESIYQVNLTVLAGYILSWNRLFNTLNRSGRISLGSSFALAKLLQTPGLL
jgi:hypothetical protein